MNKMQCYLFWINCTFQVVLMVNILQLAAEANQELGSIECKDGKWKVDTRLIAVVLTCPLPLDGNAESASKMMKCVMSKLGIYDGEDISDDFTETLCSVLDQPKLQEDCLKEANACAMLSGLRFNWELLWPGFLTCLTPWVVKTCNI